MNPKLLLTLVLVATACASQPVQEFQLPNGLRVLLLENHDRPLVRLEMRTTLDPAEEPAGMEGMIGFLGESIQASGAGPLTRDAFETFLDDRALRYSFSLNPRHLAWSVLSDSQGQDAAFESLTLGATRANLDGTQVELRRQRFIQAYKEQSPGQRAEEDFRRRAGDPAFLLLPTGSSLKRIELTDLENLMRRVIRPEKSILVVQGDMNLMQVKQLALLHLGAWGPGKPGPAFQPPPRDPNPATRTWVVNESGEAPVIKLGSATAPRIPSSDPVMGSLQRWLRRQVSQVMLGSLEKVEIEFFSNGAWLITARARKGSSTAEALPAAREALRQMGERRIGNLELAAIREEWRNEQSTRALHPQLAASHLAEGSLDQRQAPLPDPKAEELQVLLRRVFDPDGIIYHLTGDALGGSVTAEKLGLGPLQIVN